MSDRRINFTTWLDNLRQPGSASWKVRRWTTNMLIRWQRKSTCCGNDGEPGC